MTLALLENQINYLYKHVPNYSHPPNLIDWEEKSQYRISKNSYLSLSRAFIFPHIWKSVTFWFTTTLCIVATVWQWEHRSKAYGYSGINWEVLRGIRFYQTTEQQYRNLLKLIFQTTVSLMVLGILNIERHGNEKQLWSAKRNNLLQYFLPLVLSWRYLFWWELLRSGDCR